MQQDEKFEQYIRERSSSLDVEQPDAGRVWQGISSGLDRRRVTRTWYRIAAVFVLLVLAGAGSLVIRDRFRKDPFMNGATGLSVQITNQEAEAQRQVQAKMAEIRALQADPATLQQMMNELNQLDREHAGFLADLQQLGNQPRIVNGLIRCYELKIKILEQTLREAKKEKTSNENNQNLL